jgi:hypothetical protein
MQLSTSIKSVVMPSFPLEGKHGRKDSQLAASALFLKLIADLNPHVVDDLWPTFWDLCYALCKEFGKDLIGDEATNRSGHQIFDILHRQAWCEHVVFISNSEYSNWRWRALFWPLAELHKLEPARVSATFRNWKGLPNCPLRANLRHWSKKWGLDADWCRDHALIVLRRLMFDKGLQNSFLHPHEPDQDPFLFPPKAQTLVWRESDEPAIGKPSNWLTKIWSSVALEPLLDEWSEYLSERWQHNVPASREILKCRVFEGIEPDRFVVETFNDDGWNFLDETLSDFSRRVEVNFRTYLAQEEYLRLSALTKDGGTTNEADYLTLTNWRDRMLRKFKKALAKYAKLSNEHKSAVMSEGYLISTPSKRKLDHHLRLTIRYQIPNASLSTSTLLSLGKASGVSKSVKETLTLIGLKRRSYKPAGGRKRGSKNKYSSLKLGRNNKSST